jgi:2',3'-cyclic-nucleotide 2'-phosphodiesterase (5'-nucleotidase family)
VKAVRQSEKEIIVLDAGDLLFKKYLNPPPESTSSGMAEKAHLIVESFNVMGYDAMGIGDDDLTLGKDFLLEISRKARFPLLSSNLLDEASGKNLFQTSLIKEINGLRIGLFSLLSPDFFINPSDPRKKGLSFRPPFETAKAMVEELKPKTDLIILLSHLGYPNDIRVAQTIPGIHLILGAHTGINLPYPPAIKNIIILQTASKGMFGGKLNLLFYNKEPIFYNSATRISLENNLNRYSERLNSKGVPEVERTQLRRAQEETERTLKQFRSKNQFTNQITLLHEQMKDDPDIGKMLEAYKVKTRATENPVSPKS